MLLRSAISYALPQLVADDKPHSYNTVKSRAPVAALLALCVSKPIHLTTVPHIMEQCNKSNNSGAVADNKLLKLLAICARHIRDSTFFLTETVSVSPRVSAAKLEQALMEIAAPRQFIIAGWNPDLAIGAVAKVSRTLESFSLSLDDLADDEEDFFFESLVEFLTANEQSTVHASSASKPKATIKAAASDALLIGVRRYLDIVQKSSSSSLSLCTVVDRETVAEALSPCLCRETLLGLMQLSETPISAGVTPAVVASHLRLLTYLAFTVANETQQQQQQQQDEQQQQPFAELVTRTSILSANLALFADPSLSAVALSAFYRIFEWGSAFFNLEVVSTATTNTASSALSTALRRHSLLLAQRPALLEKIIRLVGCGDDIPFRLMCRAVTTARTDESMKAALNRAVGGCSSILDEWGRLPSALLTAIHRDFAASNLNSYYITRLITMAKQRESGRATSAIAVRDSNQQTQLQPRTNETAAVLQQCGNASCSSAALLPSTVPAVRQREQ